jgi:hypothetical protein
MLYSQSSVPRSMQWFFIILVTLWLIAAMILPFVVFCLTHNLFSFTFFGTLAPPIYLVRRIVWYIFPKDDRDYKLKEVQAKYAHHPRDKKRILISE